MQFTFALAGQWDIPTCFLPELLFGLMFMGLALKDVNQNQELLHPLGLAHREMPKEY